MGFFDDVMDAVSDTVSTGVKKALDLAEPLVHAFKDKDARDVAGGGGYLYTQYPDGSIIIKAGPGGLHDVKVKNGTKAWKAITTEIGPWVPPAHNSQQLSEGDEEVIILPDDHSNNNENPTEFADGLSDPYERLEFCMDDIERSLGHLRDNASSGQHNELIDRANSLCDNYPEMVRLLGELGDVPNDELNSYLDQLKSINKELQDADFADERKLWEANAGERRQLLDAMQRVSVSETLQSRYRTIVQNAENHYMYVMANAEWEAFAVECNNQLADFETGLVPVDEDSETPPYYQNEGAPADEEYPEYDGGAPITVVSSETEKDSLIKGLKAVRLWHKLSGDYVAGGSVKEIVDTIIEKADGQKIGELTISGHGHSGHQNISDEDEISARLGPEKRTELARLAEHFTSDAIVTLEGCEVGAGVDGEYLLNELASLWGVRVRGGVAYQRPILYPGMEGSVTTSVPTNNGPRIEQDDAMMNEIWRENPIDEGDDDALAFVQNAKDGELAHVSLQGRYERAKKLLSGWTGTDEGEAIVTLFRSATPADRRELYRLLESHKWEGEFHNGVFADDDGLVNALTEPQLEELKCLLG